MGSFTRCPEPDLFLAGTAEPRIGVTPALASILCVKKQFLKLIRLGFYFMRKNLKKQFLKLG